MILAHSSIGGACLAASSFFLTFVPVHLLRPHSPYVWSALAHNLVSSTVFLVPLIVGCAACWFANRRFKQMFARGVWTDEELAPVRRMVEQRVWAWGSLAVVFGALLALAWSLGHSGLFSSRFGFLYLLTLPGHAAARIKMLIAPKPISRSGLWDWRNFKPLSSDHWGR